MKIYLSGQISDGGTLPEEIVNQNKQAFREAAAELRDYGYEVVNPVELNEGQKDQSWEACMRRDIPALMGCRSVFLVTPGRGGKGFDLEQRIIFDMGIPIVDWARPPDGRDGKVIAKVAPDTPAPPEPSPLPSELQDGAIPPPSSNGTRSLLPLHFAGPGPLPRRGYADDAGLDLTVDLRLGSADHYSPLIRNDSSGPYIDVLEHGFVDIPCGLAVELPEGIWGLVTGRSSTIRRRGLLVNLGVIDTGYRGPLFAGVWNLTPEIVRVRHGERLAQLILLPNITAGYHPYSARYLTDSTRGKRGFGSTGT